MHKIEHAKIACCSGGSVVLFKQQTLCTAVVNSFGDLANTVIHQGGNFQHHYFVEYEDGRKDEYLIDSLSGDFLYQPSGQKGFSKVTLEEVHPYYYQRFIVSGCCIGIVSTMLFGRLISSLVQ